MVGDFTDLTQNYPYDITWGYRTKLVETTWVGNWFLGMGYRPIISAIEPVVAGYYWI